MPVRHVYNGYNRYAVNYKFRRSLLVFPLYSTSHSITFNFVICLFLLLQCVSDLQERFFISALRGGNTLLSTVDGTGSNAHKTNGQ